MIEEPVKNVEYFDKLIKKKKKKKGEHFEIKIN